jgi:hypothetical protein
MIIFGSGGDLVRVQSEGKQECSYCGCKQRFSLLLRYEFTHAYFIFAFVTSRRYFVTCDECQRGYEVDRAETEPTLERIPIPFLRRYGCLLGLALVMILTLIIYGGMFLTEVMHNKKR